MFSLVYVSSATELFTRTQLDDLLRASRENNAMLGITGMLLYRDGNIMQLLEGDEARVRACTSGLPWTGATTLARFC